MSEMKAPPRLLNSTRARARRPGPVTAIDFDGKMLRIVQVNAGGGPIIARMVAEPLALPPGTGGSNPALLGEAIRKGLESAKIKGGNVVMGVPRAAVALRTLALPFTDKLPELASMVHFQVNKDLPFRPEDAVIDFVVQREIPVVAPAGGAKDKPESAASSKWEILVAVARRELVEFHQKVAAAAGFKLIALGWLSDANARCLEACLGAADQGVTALVTLRPDEIGIDVVNGGFLLFSRGAAISATPSEDGGSPNFPEAVTIELVRSLHSYGGSNHPPITKVLVAGSTNHEQAVADALKQRLDKPCELFNPGEKLRLEGNASGNVAALGMALGINDARGLSFDFLNPKNPPVQRDTKRLRILAIAAAFCVLAVGGLILRAQLLRRHQKANAIIQAELTEAEKKRPIYKRMRQQVTTTQSWLKDGHASLEQYAFLSAILPGSQEFYLTSISFGAQNAVRLAVQAQNGEVLATIDKRLREAGYDVKALAVTPGADKYGYNFRSTFEIHAPAKMKIDLAKMPAPGRPVDDGSLDALNFGKPKGAPR